MISTHSYREEKTPLIMAYRHRDSGTIAFRTHCTVDTNTAMCLTSEGILKQGLDFKSYAENDSWQAIEEGDTITITF